MEKKATDRRRFIRSVVWVWAGVVMLLPWAVLLGGWFLAYLILLGFIGSTAGVCAARWWIHRRQVTPHQ